MPRHPRTLQLAQRIARVVVHILEVHDPVLRLRQLKRYKKSESENAPRVIIILPREERERKVCGVHVRELMRVGVPANVIVS